MGICYAYSRKMKILLYLINNLLRVKDKSNVVMRSHQVDFCCQLRPFKERLSYDLNVQTKEIAKEIQLDIHM